MFHCKYVGIHVSNITMFLTSYCRYLKMQLASDYYNTNATKNTQYIALVPIKVVTQSALTTILPGLLQHYIGKFDFSSIINR